MEQKKNGFGKFLLTTVVVIIIIIVLGVIIAHEGSNQSISSAPASDSNAQPASVPSTTDNTSTTLTPAQIASLYVPVSIATLKENGNNAGFEKNMNGNISLVKIKGTVIKTFPSNWFLLEDTSGDISLIELGNPNNSARVSQIVVGNPLIVDGMFFGDIQSVINAANNGVIPPEDSFIANLPTTTPFVTW